MGYPKPKLHWRVDDYLTFERASEERHEYLDGEIYAMAGESLPHGDISVNSVIALGNQLKGKPCRALTKDTKVRSGPSLKAGETARMLFSYPDVVVVCGEPEFHDLLKDIILNPTAIIEVLSPSTEVFDRGKKFERYQEWNPSLNDYLLVSQDRPRVEHYSWEGSGKWSYCVYSGLHASVVIPSIGCTLALADIYDRVVFTQSGE